jgi:hypothetical protein
MPTDSPIEPAGESADGAEILVTRMVVNGDAMTYFSVSVDGGPFQSMTPDQVRALGADPDELAAAFFAKADDRRDGRTDA